MTREEQLARYKKLLVNPELSDFTRTGRRGKSSSPNGFGFDSGLPRKSGCYALLGPDGLPVYIGVSRDIRRRVGQHKFPHDDVAFVEMSINDAEFVEMCLIAQFNPAFNTKRRTNLGRNKRMPAPAMVWIPRLAMEAG